MSEGKKVSTTLLENKNGKFTTMVRRVLFFIFILLGLVYITGCGSSISNVEIPINFIQEFIAKHETMVDKSLVYYYTKEDQSMIAEQIELACRINRSKGVLENMEHASFDFSGLHIELVDKKEEYLNDEPVLFVKVAVRGQFTIELPEESKTIETDDVLVLRMARNESKVAQLNNPWS